MLKPTIGRELASLEAATSNLSAITAGSESFTWNPRTPVEELPAALGRLREAQRKLDRLVQDAEAQVLQFLRRGPLCTTTGR